MGLKQGKILGIKVDSTSEERVLERVLDFLSHNQKFLIVTPNSEIILQAQTNKKLASALNAADIAVADSVGLKVAMPRAKIVPGRKLMVRLFSLANEKKMKIFLLGASKVSPKTIDKSLKRISKLYCHVIAAGHSGPDLNKTAQPISSKDKRLEQKAMDRINQFKPDLLFVAFGAPKQELWIKKHLPDLKVGGAMVVGGALDYFAQEVKLPPKWLADCGLEWLWRLVREPYRLPRIFRAVIIFPLKVLISKFTKK